MGAAMTVLPPDDFDASRDAVTGLPGAEAARARLGEWLARGEQVQALLVGLRRFDAVNLAYGAASGDLALGELAGRIKHFAAAELDGPWLAARGGGGQFLLLSADPCSRERWQLFAAELLDLLARPIVTAAGTVRPSPRAALLRGLADARLAPVLRQMHAGLARAWTVAQLAKTAALSRSAFFEHFTRTVGVTPMHYLLAWRMAVAKDLLARHGLGIAEVASRVGYGSASAFSAAFARVVGCSPAEFSRQADRHRS